MTDADLERWEKLATEATPGPWVGEEVRSRLSMVTYVGSAFTNEHGDDDRIDVCKVYRAKDAEFIAAARIAIPAMAAEIRRLRANG